MEMIEIDAQDMRRLKRTKAGLSVNILVNVCKQDPNELFLVASSREKGRKVVEVISVSQTRTGRSHWKQWCDKKVIQSEFLRAKAGIFGHKRVKSVEDEGQVGAQAL